MPLCQARKICVECTHIPNDFEIADSLITRMLRSPFAYEAHIHGPNQQGVSVRACLQAFRPMGFVGLLPIEMGPEETIRKGEIKVRGLGMVQKSQY